MRKLVLLAALVPVAAALASPSGASPGPDPANTKVDLINDCGPNAPGGVCTSAFSPPRDMSGPVAGFVNFSQLKNGGLRLVIAVKGGVPNADYILTLYCGATHASAGPFAHTGDVIHTNRQGKGTGGAIVVPRSELATCGPGPHTGHLDLDSDAFGPAWSTLAATGLNFSV